MIFADLAVRSKNDLIRAVEDLGVVPFFKNRIPGFSIEEHAAPELWYHPGTDEWPIWDWKGSVIARTRCAYGKLFDNKAAFVRADVYTQLANHRRDGYDFDARADDGLASAADKRLFELLDSNAPVTTKRLKMLGDYRKGGVKGFDTSIVRLQRQCYCVISDFVTPTDKNGREYGWGVSEYTTPEKFFGSAFVDEVYKKSPRESYRIVFDSLRRILPDADETELGRLIG